MKKILLGLGLGLFLGIVGMLLFNGRSTENSTSTFKNDLVTLKVSVDKNLPKEIQEEIKFTVKSFSRVLNGSLHVYAYDGSLDCIDVLNEALAIAIKINIGIVLQKQFRDKKPKNQQKSKTF